MRYANTILETIGHTPLVRLHALARDIPALMLAKLEQFNPGGSVKDRIGVPMIEAAERAGLLKPGGTIIEPTSGNTGTGLAMAAAIKGYKCLFVMTDKVADEKRRLLRAYGAELIICPASIPGDEPGGYRYTAAQLARDTPNSFRPNQYDNPNNPATHALTTGPEIWEATEGKVTHFVAGIGTAGTIIGVARYLKSMNPAIRIIGGDPEGSIYSGDEPKPYKVEGIGTEAYPGNFEPGLVDEYVRVPDLLSYGLTRRLAREEGILAGSSTGTALAAALEVGHRAKPTDVIVVLFPDTGRGYLSKIFNDEWLRENGLLEPSPDPTLRDLLNFRQQATPMPMLLGVAPTDAVAKAISLMHQYGISQLPVIEQARIVGSVTETNLLQRLASGEPLNGQQVGAWQGPPMATLPETASARDAYALFLGGQTAIAVTHGGASAAVEAVISKSDLLEFWASGVAGA
ncbi:MAG: pyridoxal-phosphate dependent enzyme [Ktedonobacterales bacterium]|nr:pyridoxal-phosphate dependent enzyme [Ktedonobacterales bacterium]